jgi:hypothetical protein
MKRRIKHNDLTAWFLQDHARSRPATLKAARNFLTRLASDKLQATSRKQQATSCHIYKQQINISTNHE